MKIAFVIIVVVAVVVEALAYRMTKIMLDQFSIEGGTIKAKIASAMPIVIANICAISVAIETWMWLF